MIHDEQKKAKQRSSLLRLILIFPRFGLDFRLMTSDFYLTKNSSSTNTVTQQATAVLNRSAPK